MGGLRKNWTEQEEEYLRAHYMVMSDMQLGEVFGRTESAVKIRRVVLKLSRDRRNPRWTKGEDAFLEENHDGMSVKELSKALGRTERAVKIRRVVLQLSREGRRQRWTKGEDAFLEENHDSMSVKELSKALGRTESSVRGRIYCMGLNDDSAQRTPREEKEQRTEDVLLARCIRCIWRHRQGEGRYCPFGSCVDGRL